MDYLFSLKPNQTFSEGISSLSKFQISGMSYNSVVQRGYEYLSSGAVYPNVEVNTGKCELEVSGNYGEYEVVIIQQGDKIYGSCDCPYEDATCKHLIASLLHLQNRVPNHQLQEADITEAIITKAEKEKNDFEKYVHNLPIEKLQKLVLEFAPEHFRKEVTIKKQAKKGNLQKVEKAFKTAAIKLNGLFNGELHGVDGFEEDSEKALERLRPFWKTLPKKVTDELVNFINNVEEAFDDNQLYDDYGDAAYEGQNFSKYVGKFIGSIPNKERKDAIQRIMETHDNLNYGCFDNIATDIFEAIPNQDLSQFVTIVMDLNYFNYFNHVNGQNGLRLYERLQPYLTDNQKEQVLTEQSSNAYFNLVLAKYYESKLNYSKAYEVLASYLNKQQPTFHRFLRNKTDVKDQQFQMIIRLCDNNLGGENTLYWIERYNEVEASIESFQTAIKHRPEKREDFEIYFTQNHVITFSQILESENRLNQVIELFKMYEYEFRNGSAIYSFFQRHKTLFPDDATIVFRKELEIYLKEAKQKHYEKVAEILTELKPILSANELNSIILVIKSKYYRRTSLMGILKRKGF
ncbi:MAG: SWIM zinc finger domain-containing protein [Saprospiraceae bacterium]